MSEVLIFIGDELTDQRAMPAASVQTVRRYALTASVAAITATGAWYGAGLKSQQEFAQVRCLKFWKDTY